MKQPILSVSLGALALAAPLLTAAGALAGTGTTCTTRGGTVVTIADPTSCRFEAGATCTSQCAPASYTATCGAMCAEPARASCTSACETQCTAACMSTRPAYTCTSQCMTPCEAGCMAGCTGNDCASYCSSTCDAECTQGCQPPPASSDCATQCHDRCSGSCDAQANACDASCASMLTDACTTKCGQPTGGLFCDGQFIDISAATDCTFSIDDTTTTAGMSCSAAPGNDSRGVLLAASAAIAGLGLFAARRRRCDRSGP